MYLKLKETVQEVQIHGPAGQTHLRPPPEVDEEHANQKDHDVNRKDWRPGKRPRTATPDQGHTPTSPNNHRLCSGWMEG